MISIRNSKFFDFFDPSKNSKKQPSKKSKNFEFLIVIDDFFGKTKRPKGTSPNAQGHLPLCG